MGARPFGRAAHDQRSCRNLARKTIFQAARCETAMFSSCRRVLEWRREGNRKVPMWIHLKSRVPFAFAALWDYWRDPAGDKELYSFTLITTEANALLRPIHHRMPVIHDKEMGRQWLEESFGNQPMILAAVLQPLPSDLMEAHEVSTLVNSPENDTAECVKQFHPASLLSRSCRYSSERYRVAAFYVAAAVTCRIVLYIHSIMAGFTCKRSSFFAVTSKIRSFCGT